MAIGTGLDAGAELPRWTLLAGCCRGALGAVAMLALGALMPGPGGGAQAQAAAESTAAAQGGRLVPFDSRHFMLERLADGVYAAIQNDDGGWAIANGGIVDLGDRTLVIDPFLTPVAAEDLRRAAQALTGRRVTLVVNTHRHNDHVRGNQVFVPGAEIIDTPLTRREMLEHEPRDIADEKANAPARLAGIEAALRTAPPGAARELRMFESYFRGLLQSHATLVTTPPTLLVEDRLTLHGTARSAEIRVLGRGHTGSDLVVWLPAQRILFAGDLVFHQRHAFLGDGAPDDWRRLLAQLRSWDPAAVVPGHGPVATAEAIDDLDRYIVALQGLVRDGQAAGRTPEQIAQSPVPEPYAGWLLRPFFAANLAFLARRAR